MHTFDKLVAKAPFGVRGRVTLGFAFDGNFLPSEVLQPLYQHVRDAGIKTITLHATGKGNIKGPGLRSPFSSDTAHSVQTSVVSNQR